MTVTAQLDLSVERFKNAMQKMQREQTTADKWRELSKTSTAKRALLQKQRGLHCASLNF
jgi:AmiR/NasT family two-component response regulator